MRKQLPIVKRLVPSLKKRLAALTWHGGRFKIVRYRGCDLLLNYRHFLDRQIAFRGDYEAAQFDHLMAEMARHDSELFVDVGANFGLYSILVARRHAALPIVAFEPDPRNASQFHANLFLNDMVGRIDLRELAVADVDGAVAFDFAVTDASGQSRLAENAGAGDGAVAIAGTRLDTVIDAAGRRLAVKVDVEGRELRVIAGMDRLLAANDCLLQIESFPQHIAAVDEALAARGYERVHTIGDDHYFRKRT